MASQGLWFSNGRPEALDFAVTSGLRSNVLQNSIHNPEAVIIDYEAYKNTYKDTRSQCEAQGLVFTPVVFEAHGGGWGAAARRIYDNIAKQQTNSGMRCREGTSMRIAQRISTAIHMANSRAILTRLSPNNGTSHAPLDLDPALGMQTECWI